MEVCALRCIITAVTVCPDSCTGFNISHWWQLTYLNKEENLKRLLSLKVVRKVVVTFV
jgi:hypothetical protein